MSTEVTEQYRNFSKKGYYYPGREQKVWSTVKRFCSCEGDLSSVCQQIIKTLILNSHKFKKVRQPIGTG
jgi:hypothetical protein